MVEWSFNPWRDRPVAAATALLFGALACAAVMSLREAALLTLGLCLAVIAALSPLLSPARCRVDDRGASRQGPFGTRRALWSELKRGDTVAGGLLLSPYPRPHWLDAYRGLLLPLPRRDRVALLAELRGLLEHHGL